MIEAVVARPELSVLDVTDEVLREHGVAAPEAIREVDPATEPLLLGTGKVRRGAPDHGSVELEAQHQIRREPSAEAPEIVSTVGPDEVRDDMPAGPIAARELVVIERHGRGSRVLEPRIEPLLPEEPEQVQAADAAYRASLREKVRGEPVANAGARATLATRVVPIELPVEPEIAARQEVAVDVREADIRIEPREVISTLLGVRADIAETRVKHRARIFAQGQARAQAVEQSQAARPELKKRGRRERHPHPRQLRVRMVAPLLELSQEHQHLRWSHPLADPGQQERLRGADADLVERRRIVGEQQRVVIAGPPRQALATKEQLDVIEGELHVPRRQSGRAILFVLEELWLNVDGEKVADLGAALEREATAGATLEGRPRTIHERKPMIRVRAKRLRSVDRGQREESDRGRGVL